MINRSPKTDDGIGSRSKRESLSGPPYRPYRLHYWNEVLIDLLPGSRIRSYPRIGGSGIVRRKRPDAETVQIDRLRIIIMDNDILVGLISPFIRGLAATSAIKFL